MTYGMTVSNDLGKLLIDNQTDQLYFVGKATYSGTSYDGDTARIYTIESPSVPLPFVRSEAGYAAISSVYDKGTHWQIVVICYLPTDLEIYCFARTSSAVASGDIGMQVFNSGGDVVFDSRLRPLKLRGLTSGPYKSSAAHGISGLTKPAAALQSLLFESYYNPTYELTLWYSQVFKIDATTIYGNMVYRGYGSWSYYPATGELTANTSIPYVPVIDGADYD